MTEGQESELIRFLPFALKLKVEGSDDERIKDVFRKYLMCRLNNGGQPRRKNHAVR
jgi:hypothetical protein